VEEYILKVPSAFFSSAAWGEKESKEEGIILLTGEGPSGAWQKNSAVRGIYAERDGDRELCFVCYLKFCSFSYSIIGKN